MGVRWIAVVTGLALSVVLGIVPAVLGQSPRTLTIVRAAEGPMDIQRSAEAESANVTLNIFDSLFESTPEGHLRSGLVESWRLTSPTVWEFRLRKGIRFTNGEELDGEVVQFNLDRMAGKFFSPMPAVGAWNAKAVSRVEIVDKQVIRLHTPAPDPVLPKKFVDYMGAVYPKGYLEKQGQRIVDDKPVGSGPYKLVEWVRGERVALEANAQYWKGRPYFDRVVFRVVPEPATRLAMLETGQADVVVDVPVDQVPRLKAKKELKVHTVTSTRGVILVVDSFKKGKPVEEPTADVRVRKAIAHAVDVRSIVDSLWQGAATPMTHLFVPHQIGYDPKFKPYAHDVAQARQLLAAAGLGGGFELKMAVPTGRYPLISQVAEVLQAQLAQVGIRVTLEPIEWAAFVQRWQQGSLPALYLVGMADVMGDGLQFLRSRILTTAPYTFRHKKDQSKEVDEKIRVLNTMMEEDKRVQAMRQLAQYVHDEAMMVPLYIQANIYATRATLDFTPYATERLRLVEIRDRR